MKRILYFVGVWFFLVCVISIRSVSMFIITTYLQSLIIWLLQLILEKNSLLSGGIKSYACEVENVDVCQKR